MKNRIFVISLLLCVLLLVGILWNNSIAAPNWALISAVFLGVVLLAFFWSFEHRSSSSKEVTLIATMAALAAVSRVPFAFIPGFQPTTFLVMITGWVFGMQSGFAVGAIAALVSNIFLGQGPWTPWQMFAWGMSGVSAAILAGRGRSFNRMRFTILAGAWGLIFGWIMNIWHWVGFVYPLNLRTFIAVYFASLPFDTMHAFGNIVFSLTFGPTFFSILSRFEKKITVSTLDIDGL